MLADARAVAWKEWRELVRGGDGMRTARLRVPLLVGIGAFLAWQLGAAFGSAWVSVVPPAMVAAITVLSMVADAVAGERERHTLETLLATRVSDGAILLGKVAAPVAYGTALGAGVLAAGLVATRLAHPGAPAPRPAVLAAALLAAALLAGLTASVGTLLSLHAGTVREAQQRLSLILLGVAILPGAAARLAPAAWKESTARVLDGVSPTAAAFALLGALALLDAALLLAARARFRRSRLILD